MAAQSRSRGGPLEWFFSLFSSTVYLAVSPEEVRAWSTSNDQTYRTRPVVAIKNGDIIAVGDEARTEAEATSDSGIELVNPFDHPRLIMSDVDVAGFILRIAVAKAIDRVTLVRPRVIIHPLHLDSFAGGLAPVELRILTEAGMVAGAREVLIWSGPELTREQARTLSFPAEGKVLGRLP
jgi:rod shape-determining protein MreB and related proteins